VCVIPDLNFLFLASGEFERDNVQPLTECALAPSVSVGFTDRILSPLWLLARFVRCDFKNLQG
jgi:hypothetical protein